MVFAAEAVNKVKGDGHLSETCSKPQYLTCEGSVAKIARLDTETEWPLGSLAISNIGRDAQMPKDGEGGSEEEDNSLVGWLKDAAYAAFLGWGLGAFAKSAGLWG
jgi:hypothetical protein